MAVKSVAIHLDEEVFERKYALKKTDGKNPTWPELVIRGMESFESEQNEERGKNL